MKKRNEGQAASLLLKKIIREEQLMSPATLHVALAQMNPMSLARAFTKIDADIFGAISLQDFASLLSKQDRKKSTHLSRFVTRFNQISKWVATEVCMIPDLKKRTHLVDFFIKFLKCLKDLDNFSSMMAVIGGLNFSPVHRLQQTWAVSHSFFTLSGAMI